MPPSLNFNGGIYLMDANDEKAATILPAPRTGTIDEIGFVTATVTTGDTVDVRLETVGATGNPSGSLWAVLTNGAKIVASTDDNVVLTTTLTASASVTMGDPLAVVISMPAVATGTIRINALSSCDYPYGASFAGGSWTKNRNPALICLHYTDVGWVYIPHLMPATQQSYAENIYNTGSAADERGNKITVPFACRVVGVWSPGADGSTGDAEHVLYSGTTVLEAKAVDGDYFYQNVDMSYFFFDTAVTLAANDVVRAIRKPTTATSTRLGTVGTNATVLNSMFGGGQMIATSRVDAGSWTDATASVDVIGLIIDQLDSGGGGVGAGIRMVGSAVARSVI